MNSVKTVFLMTALACILMALGGIFGGRNGVMIMFIIAMGMNFFSYWFSDTMVLRAYKAQQVGEDHYLYRIVADLAQRADLPMPKVYIIPTDVPMPFATGRNPSHAAVAATEGILRLLDEDEIRGVLAHEMSHVLHRDILISTIVASFASAIAMIANMAQWAAIFGGGRDNDGEGGNPIALIATALLAPLAASVIQMGISRTREYMADEEGGRMIDDPIALARASCLPELYGDTARYFDPYDYDVDLDALFAKPAAPPDKVLAKYSWEKTARFWLDEIKKCAEA